MSDVTIMIDADTTQVDADIRRINAEVYELEQNRAQTEMAVNQTVMQSTIQLSQAFQALSLFGTVMGGTIGRTISVISSVVNALRAMITAVTATAGTTGVGAAWAVSYAALTTAALANVIAKQVELQRQRTEFERQQTANEVQWAHVVGRG